MSTSLELSQLTRLILDVGAFGAIAAIGLAHRGTARWASTALVGGGLALFVVLVQLVMFVEVTYLEASYVSEFLFRRGQVAGEVLSWTGAVGVVLIAAALVACARARSLEV
jgi:hypothetical protein